MNERPYFTIIIPIFNCASSLDTLINSVQYQIFTKWECLIIDDQSTDISYHRAIELSKSNRFEVLRTTHEKKRKDPSVPRNLGISRSRGLYICFLDADDIWLSNHLLNIYNATVRDPCITVAFTAYFRKQKGHVRRRHYLLKPVPVGMSLLFFNPIPLSGSCIKSSAVRFLFPDHPHEDYLFWRLNLPLASTTRIAYIDTPSMIYTVDNLSISGNKLLSVIWMIKCYKYLGYNPVTMILAFIVYCLMQLCFLALDQCPIQIDSKM
jgi:teichuronic acid biosynthesis glycosyltransferase TuaG